MKQETIFKENVIYLRVSTTEQNFMNQLEDCESIRPIDAKTETFVDYCLLKDEQSAWKDKNRDGFEELNKMIKSNKVKNLIIWNKNT